MTRAGSRAVFAAVSVTPYHLAVRHDQRRAEGQGIPGPGPIKEYQAALSAQLPARTADGLAETYGSYLDQSLARMPQRAALAESGEPEVVVAAFTRASLARRAARRLLATGPAVGACWATVLVAGRAWNWPVPIAVAPAPRGVADLEASIEFNSKLFSTEPAKRRPGHANFAIAEQPLKLVLQEGQQGQSTVMNHLGVEVETTEQVTAATRRLVGGGLATEVQEETTCCYPVQDKVWVHGPGNEPCEVYVVKADAARLAKEADSTLLRARKRQRRPGRPGLLLTGQSER